MLTIRPILQKDIETLIKKAQEDQHNVTYPSHVVEKNGEVVGYFSILRMPMVTNWFSTKEMNARDSVEAIKTVENHCRMIGCGDIVVPCDGESPFFPFMEKLGYAEMGTATLHHKKL